MVTCIVPKANQIRDFYFRGVLGVCFVIQDMSRMVESPS